MEADSWKKDMDEVRTYFKEHTVPETRGVYLALLDSGGDNGKAHAVVITGKLGNGTTLYMYDPQFDKEVKQGEQVDGVSYSDSHILCTILITGKK